MSRLPIGGNYRYADGVAIVGVGGNLISSESFGEAGAVTTNSTTPVTGSFAAIQILENTTFSAFTMSNLTGSLTGFAIPAGTVIYGDITSFTLTSGRVIAYRSVTV